MDETGIKASTRWCERFSLHKLQRIELPLSGNKQEKDISDYFKLGNSTEDFRKLISDHLEQLYTQTIMLLSSCEINYNNPPDRSKTVISVNDVPLGTYDNLFCSAEPLCSAYSDKHPVRADLSGNPSFQYATLRK